MPDSRKKILIVAPYFYPNIEWGGPVTVSFNHVTALKNAGYQVTVLTTDATCPGNVPKNAISNSDGINIVYAKSILKGLAWNFRIFLSIDQILKGWKMISQFDVVHFQDTFVLQNILLAIRCKALRTPYVITPHGSLNFTKERGKSLIKRCFINLLSKKYLKSCSKIIAVSGSEKENIDQTFPYLKRKTVYIPNIVQTNMFTKIDLRSKLDIPSNDLIILYLGRIYGLKGVVELASGFLEYLKKYNRSATLIFAGPDAGSVDEIKKTLKGSDYRNKVIFTGEVMGDYKSNLIYGSDTICLLSKSESMPTVLLEAASYVKPIICTKECNMNSLTSCGGALLTDRSPESIALNISKLENKKTRTNMGRKAKDWFDINYDTAKIINQYKDIYANAK